MSPTQLETAFQRLHKKCIVFFRSYKLLIELGVVIAAALVAYVVYSQLPSVERKVAEVVQSGNIEDCREFEDTFLSGTQKKYADVCRENIALRRAAETNNPSECQALEGTQLSRESCEAYAKAGGYQKDTTISCEAISADDRVLCINTRALSGVVEESRPNACTSAKTGSERLFCQQMIAGEAFVQPGDLSCDIFVGDIKSECTVVRALKSGFSVDMCNQFQTPFANTMCEQKALINQSSR